MDAPSALLLCMLLATCSAWTGNQQADVETSVEADVADVVASVTGEKLSGMCWICKKLLNKVKQALGPNATQEDVISKLSGICDLFPAKRDKCNKFLVEHLSEIIKDLLTTGDVTTMCIKAGACKRKELMNIHD